MGRDKFGNQGFSALSNKVKPCSGGAHKQRFLGNKDIKCHIVCLTKPLKVEHARLLCFKIMFPSNMEVFVSIELK